MAALFLYTQFMFGYDPSWGAIVYLSGLWIVVLYCIFLLIVKYRADKKDPTKSPELRILLLLITIFFLGMVLITFIILGIDSGDQRKYQLLYERLPKRLDI